METSLTQTEAEICPQVSAPDNKLILVIDEAGDPPQKNSLSYRMGNSVASSDVEYHGRKKSAGSAQLGPKYCPRSQECSILAR